MRRLPDYAKKYRNAKIEREDGVLHVALHDGAGGTMKWCESAHTELPFLFRDIAADLENRSVLLTGTGGGFISSGQPGDFRFDATVPSSGVDRLYREGGDLLFSLLDINVPVVAAISGNACPRAELALISDIVIAATDTLIRDAHFSNNTVPGDGVQVIWTALLGMNRGRSYLLTGRPVTVAEALEWGLVTEVVPPGQEIECARKYAQDIAKKHPFVIRHTREVFTLELKRRLRAEMPLGLALEGLANGYGNWR
jgi:enoyl-CoA hydratase/carnithine racemase